MTLQVTVNDIILKEDNLVNEGEYNVKTINFEFSDEYTDLIKKCRFYSTFFCFLNNYQLNNHNLQDDT